MHAATVAISAGRGLSGEAVSFALLEVMLKFWGETRQRRKQSRVMVTLKGILKGKAWGKWHLLPLVDMNDSRI